jgi:hypothetical protein
MRFPLVGAVSAIAALVYGSTAQQLGPYGEVLTPDGKVWGLKEAFEGTFKVGVSFVRHKQLFRDPVWAKSISFLTRFCTGGDCSHVTTMR